MRHQGPTERPDRAGSAPVRIMRSGSSAMAGGNCKSSARSCRCRNALPARSRALLIRRHQGETEAMPPECRLEGGSHSSWPHTHGKAVCGWNGRKQTAAAPRAAPPEPKCRHAGGPSCLHALKWAHLHAGMQKQNDGDAGSSFRRPGAGRRLNSISKPTIQGARPGSVGSGQHPGSCGSKASTWGDDPGEIRHPGRPAPPWLSLRKGAALPTGLHGGGQA